MSLSSNAIVLDVFLFCGHLASLLLFLTFTNLSGFASPLQSETQCYLQLIDHLVPTPILPLRFTEILYSSFILVKNHQKSVSTALDLGHGPEVNDCELNTIATGLPGPTLSGWGSSVGRILHT